jgi:hypothetical protein
MTQSLTCLNAKLGQPNTHHGIPRDVSNLVTCSFHRIEHELGVPLAYKYVSRKTNGPMSNSEKHVLLIDLDDRLFIHGGRAVLARINREHHQFGGWLDRLEARSRRKGAIVAMANKIARMAWAVLISEQSYCALGRT